MSSLSSLPRQRLPNEVLTNVLMKLEPWEAWPLRLVCANFNNYLMRYLGPRQYAPLTSIFIRGEESWMFEGANTDAVSSSEESLEVGDPDVPAAPLPTPDPGLWGGSHTGDKFSFQAVRPAVAGGSPVLADFILAHESRWNIVQLKLDEKVQVIFRIGTKYFRHVFLPSLVIKRSVLTLTLDWAELFNEVLNMPEEVRLDQESRAWPTKLFIPHATMWVPPDEDYDTETDSDMDLSPEGDDGPVVYHPPTSEGGEESVDGESHVHETLVADPPEPVAVATETIIALTELTPDMLAEPGSSDDEEENVPLAAGFSHEDLSPKSVSDPSAEDGHTALPVVSPSEGRASAYAYGTGFTTTEEALAEAFAPSSSSVLPAYASSEVASEGGHEYEAAISIDVTSDGASVRPRDISSAMAVSVTEITRHEPAPPTSSLSPADDAVRHAAGESFLLLEESSLENTSSDSAAVAATAGVAPIVVYRDIGVQVLPFQLASSADSGLVTRHRSWP